MARIEESDAVKALRREITRRRFLQLMAGGGAALVAGCDFLVTTAKDEARLEGWRPSVLTYVLEQSVEILANFDVLNDFLDRIISSLRLRGNPGDEE